MTAEEITRILRKRAYPVATEGRLQFEIAADQSRGIVTPGEQAETKDRDDQRMRRLAEHVLNN